jgi:hypothetical protein
MIRAAFSSLAGAWIARNVEQGEIPERFAIPLTLLATRLPTPVILAGAIGYGLYRMNLEARAMAAKDVTPKRRARQTAARAKAASQRARRTTKPKNSGEREA